MLPSTTECNSTFFQQCLSHKMADIIQGQTGLVEQKLLISSKLSCVYKSDQFLCDIYLNF